MAARIATILWVWLLCAGMAAAEQPSVAFFHGLHPPVDVLQSFDWVVVQPYANIDPRRVTTSHTRYFAYVSLGEMDKTSSRASRLPSACRLGTDAPWNSWIIDQANPSCRRFYLNHVVKPLLARGFNGFFLDTLDSYEQVLKTPDALASYRKGLITLIQSIRRLDPKTEFILNRGFKLLPSLHQDGILGVAAESLYKGWNQMQRRYVDVKPRDSRWLLQKLKAVQQAGLVAIAIDYLPPDRPRQAKADARRIAADGIVPYVTNAKLDIVGTGSIRVMPRRILMLYSGSDDVMHTYLTWFAAMPLNYLGYATRTLNIGRSQLPAGPLTGQVAGIVTWFGTDNPPHTRKIYDWLRMQMKAGVPVVLLGQFGFPSNRAYLAPLGLDAPSTPGGELHKARITHENRDFVGFEGPVLPSAASFAPLTLARGHALLDIEVAGKTETAIALTPWGGYALAPYVVRSLPRGDTPRDMLQSSWILNPFAFFKAALRLPTMPAPDTTTASGRRLLFAQIDGDGFASGSWNYNYRGQPAAQVILDRILKRYRIPTAASVIASEFVEDGLYPKQEVDRLRPIARAIFKLPWVEIGSHTYSHPFDWPALEHDPNLSAGLHLGKTERDNRGYVRTQGLKYGYNLPIPGYRFNPAMEVSGAIDIINRVLAPPGKRVRILQWSGDVNPDAGTLALAYRAGVMNINGINSTIDHAHSSLTNVAPLGVWKGEHFQVFAADSNEDSYTHGWKPPYCGYRKVLQTFEMTDRPRRLAPIDIYYHYYSGARTCALQSLDTVYRWALARKTTPVFPSTYARIALGFEQAAIARTGDGYLIRGYGADQTLRITAAMGYPNLAASRNVVGFNDHGDARYIHLGPGGSAYLVLSATPPGQPYLHSANGRIIAFSGPALRPRLTLDAKVPLEITLANIGKCRVLMNGHPLTGRRAHKLGHYHLRQTRAQIYLDCPSR
ncbi:MAG TPA: hypothetical protein ENI71_03190 [Chromatiales bacterium]|nr:hypothetical protein [Chromatiales bacterium]